MKTVFTVPIVFILGIVILPFTDSLMGIDMKMFDSFAHMTHNILMMIWGITIWEAMRMEIPRKKIDKG